MLRTRKRWISLLVTLAMLVAFCLPTGVAFADSGTASFSATKKAGLKDGAAERQQLGYITISDMTTCDVVYAEVALPDGVDLPVNAGDLNVNMLVYVENGGTPSIVSGDKDDWIVAVSNVTDGTKIYLSFNNNIQDPDTVSEGVYLDGAPDEIKVSVHLRGLKFGGQVLDKSAELTVGTLGDAEVTVSAASPKAINVGQGRKIAKITISENLPGILNSDDDIILTLPDGFEWASDSLNQVTKQGVWGLKVKELVITADDPQEMTIKFDDPGSSGFADKVEIEFLVDVFPSAPEGEVEVDVTVGDDFDPHLDDTTLVVAVVGDSDVGVTVDEGSGDDLFVATTGKKLRALTFESSLSFKNDDEVILELPEGFEWAHAKNTTVDNLSIIGIFNDGRGLWAKLTGLTSDADEFTIDDLKVNIAADAPIGDIELKISGDLVETSVVAGECLARVDISATKPVITVGLDRAAGEITFVETDKETLSVNKVVYLTAPTGVTFAGKPTVKVNGDKKGSVELVEGDSKVKITLAGLRTSRIDTIVVSDIKLDLDSRVGYGDVLIEVGGNALNELGTTEVNGTDGEDPVAKVAVATVVSPTAGKATMKIGDPTIVINGETKVMETAPYIKNQRTYVSVTYAALACGVAPENIMWDGVNRTVTVIKGDRIAQFKIGSNVMTLNGAVINMDTAPEIVNARTMMPVTWVALALGGNTGWDAATQTVTVTVN